MTGGHSHSNGEEPPAVISLAILGLAFPPYGHSNVPSPGRFAVDLQIYLNVSRASLFDIEHFLRSSRLQH